MDRAVALERQTEHWPSALVLRPTYAFAQLLKYTSGLDEARGAFRVLLETARDRGDENPIPVLLYHLAELECWAGNWEEAAKHAEEAVETAQQAGMRFSTSLALYARCLVGAHQGRVEEALAAGREGLLVAGETGVALSEALNLKALGFLHLSVGDPGEAHGYLERALALASSMGVSEPAYLRLEPDAVEALVELGQHDRAEAMLAPFEKRATGSDTAWTRATAARSRGLLEAARGDVESAVAVLRRAVELHDRVGQPFELGRTLLALGRALRRGKQKRATRESLEQSASIFESLGARLWAERARAEISRIGGRAAGTVELTPTEARVATLAADGMTNREIADALFMTLRTVEWNLSKVYRKLQVRSRSELARRRRNGVELSPRGDHGPRS
jgi:ATP/maltotriose-dependent transcriptional regulator MalT